MTVIVGTFSSGPIETVGWSTADIGLIVLFALFSLALGFVGYRWVTRDDETADGESGQTAVDTGPDDDRTDSARTTAPDNVAATNGASALTDGAGEPASIEATRPIGRPTAGSFSEPTSDEIHVLELLEANGGRMKQARIIEETTWSRSKVSTLLSEMAEEDTITKIRLGRENIICLDGEEPELAHSPSDDEQGPA